MSTRSSIKISQLTHRTVTKSRSHVTSTNCTQDASFTSSHIHRNYYIHCMHLRQTNHNLAGTTVRAASNTEQLRNALWKVREIGKLGKPPLWTKCSSHPAEQIHQIPVVSQLQVFPLSIIPVSVKPGCQPIYTKHWLSSLNSRKPSCHPHLIAVPHELINVHSLLAPATSLAILFNP